MTLLAIIIIFLIIPALIAGAIHLLFGLSQETSATIAYSLLLLTLILLIWFYGFTHRGKLLLRADRISKIRTARATQALSTFAHTVHTFPSPNP